MNEEHIVFTRLTHYVPINFNGFLSHEASREHWKIKRLFSCMAVSLHKFMNRHELIVLAWNNVNLLLCKR